MKVLEDMNRCYGCAACANICPHDAIKMVAQSDGFLYPTIDEDLCTNCGACKKVCPVLNVTYENARRPKSYAVMANDQIRSKSASGGMFTLLAELVLEQGGYVCGAAFTDGFRRVEHIIIDDVADLDKLRRSKYIQSENGSIHKQIKTLLTEGKTVLFTGTPCQCSALKCYLRKPYENLIIVDLICHSTPSPLAWGKFLDEIGNGREIKDVNFRYKGLKDVGWSSTMYVNFDNDEEYIERFKKDLFEQAFSQQLISRKSCGKCQFARIPRQGDITIGDFWGVSSFDKKLNDKKGLSIIFINSEKGEKILEELEERKVFKKKVEVPLENAIMRNSNTYRFPQAHPGRQQFFDSLQSGEKFSNALTLSKNKKYDIILFSIWYAANYGSSLTNFALYNVLEDMGYRCSFAEIPDILWSDSKTHRDPTFVTRRFGNKHFSVTKRYANRTDLKNLNSISDIFLVGSDQIWNYNLCKSAETYYFLDFVDANKRKIAYGTSFGHKNFNGGEEARKRVGFYLQQFNSVSVREDYAVDLCEREFGVPARQVLDPVFLCDKKHYLQCIKESQFINNPPQKKYLVAYILDPNEEKQTAIEYVAKKLGLEYVCIPNALVKNDMRANWRLKYKEDLDVEDWLYYFKNAEMVITDSFHGTCFSLIFEHPFIAIGNRRRGLDRFYSLLGEVNLLNCLVEDAKDIIDNDDLLNQNIDYTVVNAILEKEKQSSLAWLNNALTKDIGADVYSAYDILDRRIDSIVKKIDGKDVESKGLFDQQKKTHDELLKKVDSIVKRIDRKDVESKGLFDQQEKALDELLKKVDTLSVRQAELINENQTCIEQNAKLIKTIEADKRLILAEEARVNELLQSKSFKIGRAITFIPRKLRDLFKSKKKD